MKIIKRILLISILLIIYVYTLIISYIPDNLVVFEGENLKINTILGIDLKAKDNYETVLTSSNVNNKSIDQIGNTKLSVNLFKKFFIKDVNVSVIPKTKVIPLGNLAGVKLYTSGVLVVGMSEIEGVDNNKYKPYENSGIEEGDMIVEIDNTAITCTTDLINTVNKSAGKELCIEFVRDGKTEKCNMTPTKTEENEYKLGLWVRDSAAGVGTVTFYEPSTQMFGALGHGITDIDTDKLIDIASGEFVTTKIVNVIKGEKGKAGKIQGAIENSQNIGQIYKNTPFGIYGKLKNTSSISIDTSKEMEVAYREEIKTGKAKILCNLDNQSVKEYEIEIEKIFVNNSYDNKSMLIKVTDKELLNKTGGIIQGMSGSPIIQNGKFIGAVTHVLLNNPQEGYAVFGDLMIKQMREVK